MRVYTNARDERYFMECDVCGEEDWCRETSKNKYICKECEHDLWMDHCEEVGQAKREDN